MTSIEWTDETWNPVTGCSHVSDGCRNCYAEDIAKRFSGTGSFPVFKPWTAPNAAHNVVLHPDRLDAPLHWRKPRRVFVNSMSDLFHELVPEEFIDRVFAVMALTPQHTYQVLSKRPAYPREANGGRVGHYVGLHDRKGGDPAEWPDDLRVREWPTEGVKA